MRTRRIPRPLIIVPLVIGICFVLYVLLNFIFSPYWDSVYTPTGYFSMASMKRTGRSDTVYTKQQACDDIDYLVKYLKRVHPDFIDGIPDDLTKLIEDKKDSFGEEVGTIELWRAAAEITSAVGDSETLVMPSFEQDYLVDYINKIDSGYTPVSVNGKTIGEILDDNSRFFSYDTDAYGERLITALIQSRDGLEFLNINSDKIIITYLYKGETETAEYTESDFFPYEDAVSMIVQTEQQPYTDENDIHNIIIDFSNLSSGTSQVADEIIMYLSVDEVTIPGGEQRMGPYMMKWDSEKQQINHYDDLLYDGNVYLLISEKTASAGVMASEMLIDNGLAVSVGTPCGTMPDCCGDVAVFQTPNAVLSFQISTKRFNRIDESKSGLPLEPEVICEGDPLEEAINMINK